MAITSLLDKIEIIYIGYFGRAAEPDGANYWGQGLHLGTSTMADVAASFSVQPETTALYPYLADPAGNDPNALIESVYQNLFNRLPDTEGKFYWSEQLTARHGDPAAVGQFILDVISGAYGVEGSASDVATIENKIQAADYFTLQLIKADIGGTHFNELGYAVLDEALVGPAHNAIFSVTADTDTVNASRHATDALIDGDQTAGDGNTGEPPTGGALSLVVHGGELLHLTDWPGVQSVDFSGEDAYPNGVSVFGIADSGVLRLDASNISGDGYLYMRDATANQSVEIAVAGNRFGIELGNGNNNISTGDNGGFIILGRGSNAVVSGAGNDTVTLSHQATVNLPETTGANVVDVGDGDNGVYVYEHGDITIRSGAGRDTILSYGDGHAEIQTGAGNDNVQLYGVGESSSVDSGAGNDTIAVTQGSYNLTGGLGADTYYLNGFQTQSSSTIHIATVDSAFDPSVPNNDSSDTIAGFKTGVDRISFGLQAGNAANFFHGETSVTKVLSYLQDNHVFNGVVQYALIHYLYADSDLFVDADLDGKPDMRVHLAGTLLDEFAASDII